MIFDAHADILTDIYIERKKGNKNVFKNRHLENFKKGKVKLGVFNIWIDPFESENANRELLETLEFVRYELDENKDILKNIKNKDDINLKRDNEQINFLMGVEGLKSIEDDIGFLDDLYDYGIRSASLTWNEENKLATGVLGEPNRGLTDLGRKAVKKIEELNMILDVSHSNKKTFWDIVDLTNRPIIASHSNSKTICNHVRNLEDSQIRAIKESGGFIGVNIHKNFVSEIQEEQNISVFINHIDYIVDLIGINNIGFGFDFCEYLDNESTNIKEIENISHAQKIIQELKNRGYSRNDIEKISYKNFKNLINKILI